jgi:molybdate transport system regulatory protein
MNSIPGTIANIEQSGSIILADIDIGSSNVSAMLIASANGDTWISKNKQVQVVFKETEVSLAKDLSGKISLRNRFQCIVKHIEKGNLLSKVTLECGENIIVSVITTRSLNDLGIHVNDNIEALIKANEISLMAMK